MDASETLKSLQEIRAVRDRLSILERRLQDNDLHDLVRVNRDLSSDIERRLKAAMRQAA